jgi:hypothetical protein
MILKGTAAGFGSVSNALWKDKRGSLFCVRVSALVCCESLEAYGRRGCLRRLFCYVSTAEFARHTAEGGLTQDSFRFTTNLWQEGAPSHC